MAIVCAILIPPGAILVLIALMASEADYTFLTRLLFFQNPTAIVES
jgi:cytochrome c oxidase subunit IV